MGFISHAQSPGSRGLASVVSTSVVTSNILGSTPSSCISPFGNLLNSLYKSAKADCAEEPGAAARRTGPVSQFFEVRPIIQGQTAGKSKPAARSHQSTRLCAGFVKHRRWHQNRPGRRCDTSLSCRFGAANLPNPAVTHNRTPSLKLKSTQ
jgi:hypothetical protein